MNVKHAVTAANGSTDVQKSLDKLQAMQEAVVNAGHRPDRAVSAILDLEAMRQAVIKADTALMRALWNAEDQADQITRRLNG